jgi:hypothetical protein
MHGDFSRNSFEPKHNFARVLMQQGRLIVDADWNEQSAVLLHYIQSIATDVIGWHGGPSVVHTQEAQPGPPATPLIQQAGPFCIVYDSTTKKLTLSANESQFRYYVDGLMLEGDAIVEKEIVVLNPNSNDEKILVFLDVFETFIPSFSKQYELLDPALNGRDTCARSQIRHQIRAVKVNIGIPLEINRADFLTTKYFYIDPTATDRLSLNPRVKSKTGTMLAMTTQDNSKDCIPDPGQGFVGLENQLYRIEIHRGGTLLESGFKLEATDEEALKKKSEAATFKWSRDNGSLCYPGIVESQTIRLLKNWPDSSKAIEPKQVVEVLIEGDDLIDGKQSGALHRIKSISESTNGFQLEFESGPALPANKTSVLVRRWDHKQSEETPLHENGLLLREGSEGSTSLEIPIEDGILVQFKLPEQGKFFPGDYWLVPARVATGGIIWQEKEFVTARFIEHHYAPIALVDTDKNKVLDLRRSIVPIANSTK